MLYPYNEYLLKNDVQETTTRYLREAEIDHLVHTLFPHRPSGLSYAVRRALSTVGHWLVTLGQRLDRIETRPT